MSPRAKCSNRFSLANMSLFLSTEQVFTKHNPRAIEAGLHGFSGCADKLCALIDPQFLDITQKNDVPIVRRQPLNVIGEVPPQLVHGYLVNSYLPVDRLRIQRDPPHA